MGVVVFLGPPGVGKGTQASYLNDRLGASHISTGALLREEIETRSSLGLEIKDVMARGDLVDDDQLFQCLENKLERVEGLSGKLLLLDGVPRTRSQVTRLDGVLAKHGLKVGLALNLSAPVEQLIERFAMRWSCRQCGQIYSYQSAPVAGHVCSKCGGSDSLVRRKDDEPESVRHRFKVFEQETAPLVSEYEDRGILRVVNGLGEPELSLIHI